MNEIIHVAIQQGHTVDGFSGDELTYCGIAGLFEVHRLRYGHSICNFTDPQRNVDGGHLVNIDSHLVLRYGFKALEAGGDLIIAGI